MYLYTNDTHHLHHQITGERSKSAQSLVLTLPLKHVKRVQVAIWVAYDNRSLRSHNSVFRFVHVLLHIYVSFFD